MRALLDFFALIVFFVCYKLYGIFPATAVLIGVTVLQYGIILIRKKSLKKQEWITLVAVLLFGGLTLILHDEAILKWKAPVLNWIFAVVFFAVPFFRGQTLAETMVGKTVKLSSASWKRLNLYWVLFFLISGGVHLFVAFRFHEIWVDFKLFGSLGMFLVFAIFNGFFIRQASTSSDIVKSE